MADDNVHGLTARKQVLEDLGHKVTTARTGAEALELFAQYTFDLVITDYKMPHMTGLELIQGIRAQRPEVPVILLSGFVDALGMNEESTGANAVIQKSANELSHLIRAVDRLLNRPFKPSTNGHHPPKKPNSSGGTYLPRTKRRSS